MRIIIMRGIPGSGKSTYVKKHFPDAVVCSADSYFYVGEKYEFDGRKLSEAHGYCLRTYSDSLQHLREDATLVVDNTNTTLVEIAPYEALASAFGHQSRILTLDVQPEVAARRQVHDVPHSIVWHMFQRLREENSRFPIRWNHTVIDSVVQWF